MYAHIHDHYITVSEQGLSIASMYFVVVLLCIFFFLLSPR